MAIPREQAIEELTKRAQSGNREARRILIDKNVIEPFEPLGGIGKFAQSILKPAATVALRPAQAIGTGIGAALGRTPTEQQQTLEVPFLGKIAPPSGVKDVVRDIGRIAETASFGIGGGAISTVGKAGLKGALKQAAARGSIQGAKGGGLFGAGQQLENQGEVGAGTVGSAALGATGGALLGAGIGTGLSGASLLSQAAARSLARRLPSKTQGVLGDFKNRVQVDDAVRITKPVLSKKERIQAIRSGRAEESGFPFFRKVEITKPSPHDKEVAKAASGIINNTNNQVKNISRIDDEVTRINQDVNAYLEQNNAIFSNKELISRLRNVKEESRVIFGSDTTLENRYDAVIDELIRSIEKGDLLNLLKARQSFDSTVRRKFPRTFDGDPGDNVTRNAILDVRRGVNEFIAEKLPTNNPFKTQLKQQHLLLEAVENLAEQAEQKIPSGRRGLFNLIVAMVGGGFMGAVGGSVLGAFTGKGGGD